MRACQIAPKNSSTAGLCQKHVPGRRFVGRTHVLLPFVFLANVFHRFSFQHRNRNQGTPQHGPVALVVHLQCWHLAASDQWACQVSAWKTSGKDANSFHHWSLHPSAPNFAMSIPEPQNYTRAPSVPLISILLVEKSGRPCPPGCLKSEPLRSADCETKSC